MPTKGQLITMMKTIGYHYDDINSYDEWIIFNFETGKIEFDSWYDVYEWLNEVCD